MAQVTTVTLIDDLDGSATDDIQSVAFSYAGKSYVIDLAAGNRDALGVLLEPYVSAARRADRVPGSAPRPARQRAASDAQEIREWAKAHGVAVSQRGRIPAEVREQYLAAR